MTKFCLKCKSDKLIDCFYKNKNRKDGLTIWCKECQRIYNQRPERKIYRKKYYWDDPELNKQKTKNWQSQNKKEISGRRKIWYRKNLNIRFCRSAKNRSKEENCPFDIIPEDIIIPEYCPVLGIPLFVSDNNCSDNSPSLDKVIPELGYIKTNIVVMSHRANTIKNNATIEELEKIVNFLRKHTNDNQTY